MIINLDTIIYICGFIVTLSGAIAIMTKVVKKAIVKSSEEVISKAMKECSNKTDAKIQELTKKLNQYAEHADKSDEIMKESLLASTRSQINQSLIQYRKREHIGAHSLFVIEELYRSYKKLGGNSFIDEQMQLLRTLPVVNGEDIDDQD